jgi:hypothetical protein
MRLIVLLLAGRAIAAPVCRCAPNQPCWPTAAEWKTLAAKLHGVLEKSPAPRTSENPFALQDEAGATEVNGWLDAWSAAPSAWAVVAHDADDVRVAVQFAREHNLKLVVKGTGHDYLGRSSAPDSLLVWTHAMRRIESHDKFVASGCAPSTASPAVSLGAGVRWLEAYQEVTVKHGRYVQGGGCTSVGAAGGFLQGGGFGSFSKRYGTAASSLLEAEVVTADGKSVLANACTNADLFWALKGGGGGTFGVVTRVTLKTHELPANFGGVDGTIKARDDASFRALLEKLVAFWRERMVSEHWGEQIKVRGSNELEFSLASSGLTAKQAEERWQPFRDFIAANKALDGKLELYELPARKMWDWSYLHQRAPDEARLDTRSTEGASAPRWWWNGDSGQVGMFLYAYKSRWLPLKLFDEPKRLAAALFEASRHFTVGLHFNKGLAGASPEAAARRRDRDQPFGARRRRAGDRRRRRAHAEQSRRREGARGDRRGDEADRRDRRRRRQLHQRDRLLRARLAALVLGRESSAPRRDQEEVGSRRAVPVPPLRRQRGLDPRREVPSGDAIGRGALPAADADQLALAQLGQARLRQPLRERDLSIDLLGAQTRRALDRGEQLIEHRLVDAAATQASRLADGGRAVLATEAPDLVGEMLAHRLHQRRSERERERRDPLIESRLLARTWHRR